MEEVHKKSFQYNFWEENWAIIREDIWFLSGLIPITYVIYLKIFFKQFSVLCSALLSLGNCFQFENLTE